MQCQSCGSQFPDGSANCPNCGAPVMNNFNPQNQPYGQPQYNQQGQPYGQPYYNQQGQPYGQPYYNQQGQPYYQPYGNPGVMMTKSQFLKHPNLKKCKSNIVCSAVMFYICAAISFIVNVLVYGNIFSITDVALLVGLGLGIQLAQSRACAVITCVYAVLNVIYMIVSTGRLGGYLILIAAIYAVIYTFKFQKSWQLYRNTGMLPSPM